MPARELAWGQLGEARAKWRHVLALHRVMKRLETAVATRGHAPSYAAHNVYLGKLRTGVRTIARLESATLDGKAADEKMAESMRAITEGRVVLELDSEEAAASVEYWKQGDSSLYTKDCLRPRS